MSETPRLAGRFSINMIQSVRHIANFVVPLQLDFRSRALFVEPTVQPLFCDVGQRDGSYRNPFAGPLIRPSLRVCTCRSSIKFLNHRAYMMLQFNAGALTHPDFAQTTEGRAAIPTIASHGSAKCSGRSQGRLVDKVISSSAEITVCADDGKRFTLTSVGARASDISAVYSRYMLRKEVSDWCCELVRSSDPYLHPQNPFLRMPSERFWLEWTAEGPGQGKMGMLVHAAPNGRSGVITGYYERADGQADLLILDTHFDLDGPIVRGMNDIDRFGFRNADHPQLNPLFAHSVAVLDPSWTPYLRHTRRGTFRQSVTECIEHGWHLLPFVLAFSALMQSQGTLRAIPSDLARLNRRRSRQGRPELQEHLEVRLDLSRQTAAVERGATPGSSRAAPRLHYVRGHVVHRRGRSFWRAPHLRGRADAAIMTRTVHVSGCPTAMILPDISQGKS